MVQRRVQGYLVLVCTTALLSGCASAFSDNTTTAGARPLSADYGEINLVQLLDPDGSAQVAKGASWASFDKGQKIDLAFDAFHRKTDHLAPELKMAARNQLQERLLGASNERCHEYQQYMQNVNSGSNFALGFLTTAAGAAGAIVTGGASQILAGTAAAASGTRAEFNQDYFYDITVSTIFEGINSRRASTYEKIKKDRQNESFSDYSIETAVKDAISYHSECSLITGVQELGKSVQLAKDPGLDAVNRALIKINIARDIEDRKSTNPLDLYGQGTSSTEAIQVLAMRGTSGAADMQEDPINAFSSLMMAAARTEQAFISHTSTLKRWPIVAAAGPDYKKLLVDAVGARAKAASDQLGKCQKKILAASAAIAEARVAISSASSDSDKIAAQAKLTAKILEGQARNSELEPAVAWLREDLNKAENALNAADQSAAAEGKAEMDAGKLKSLSDMLTKSPASANQLSCAS